jgi:hypothetical protein
MTQVSEKVKGSFGSPKNKKKISAVIFCHFLVIKKTLDLDWIRNRIGIQPKMADPNPYQMNTDPKNCFLLGPGTKIKRSFIDLRCQL